MLLTCLHFTISNSLPFQTGDCGRYPWATGRRAQLLLPFSLGNWMCCQWTWRYFTSCIILDLPVLKTGRSDSVIFQQHLHVQQDGVPGWGICSTVIWSTVEVRRWKVGFSALAPLDHFITVPKPDLCSVKSLTARDATGCWDPAHSLFLLPCGQWEHASVNQTHLGPFSQFSAKLYQTGEFRSLIAQWNRFEQRCLDHHQPLQRTLEVNHPSPWEPWKRGSPGRSREQQELVKQIPVQNSQHSPRIWMLCMQTMEVALKTRLALYYHLLSFTNLFIDSSEILYLRSCT